MMPPVSQPNQNNTAPRQTSPTHSAAITGAVSSNNSQLAQLLQLTDEAPDLVASNILEFLTTPKSGQLHAIAERSPRNQAIADKLITSIAVTEEEFPAFLEKYQNGAYARLSRVTLPQQIRNEDLQAFLRAAPHAPFHLAELNLEGCNRLTEIPPLPEGLQRLDASCCYNLRTLQGPLPQSLTSLDLTDCYLIETLPQLPNGLEQLHLEGLELLRSVEGPSPTALHILNLAYCTSLQSLPADLPVGLTVLTVTGCPQFNHGHQDFPAALIVNR